MKSTLRLGLRLLRRDWVYGELRVLLFALVVAVASMTAVGFFIDRIEQAMLHKASDLLGADLVILSTSPIDESAARAAAEGGLRTARTLAFRSVLVFGERFQLAEVKAVSDGYPLRGRLRVSATPFAADEVTDDIPKAGTAWLDSRLFGALGVDVGDDIEVGARTFRIERVLSYESDRGGDLFSIAPRLMLNYADVPSTQLVQPGSRVKHRLLIAGAPDQVDGYRRSYQSSLATGEAFQGISDARPEMRVALDRARQFLSLASLVSVLLAGVAVAIASRRHAERHLDAAAVMRCLGASQRVIVRVYAFEVLALGLVASLVGCLVGYFGQSVLVHLLRDAVGGELPAPSLVPIGYGVGIGTVTLAGFALPPLLHLKNVPPARVLRRDLGNPPRQSVGTYLAALGVIAVLILWHAADLRLTTYVLVGASATLAVLAGGAWLLVRSLSGLRARVGVAWRFGFTNLTRRSNATAVQVVAFGLGITALLLLGLVRTDLLDEWQRNLPLDTPNFFLVNIQPDEVDTAAEFLRQRGLSSTALYPMVRARLSAINDTPVSEDDYQDPRAKRLATREFNLSWAERLQGDNAIVAGRWWTVEDYGKPLISVEQGIAQTLGINLGDELTYNIAGEELRLRVGSLRTVEWDTFQVNFFVVAPPGVLEDAPATFITSFYLPRDMRSELTELVREFPSVTPIDVDALLAKVREIMDQAVRAIEYVHVFTLVAGLAVLFAAIQATLDERRREAAIVRALGARRGDLLRALLAEFATLGLLAGVLAAAASTLLGAVLATRVLGLSYEPDVWVWLAGALGGVLGVGVAGTLGTRRVLEQPPIQSLREL